MIFSSFCGWCSFLTLLHQSLEKLVFIFYLYVSYYGEKSFAAYLMIIYSDKTPLRKESIRRSKRIPRKKPNYRDKVWKNIRAVVEADKSYGCFRRMIILNCRKYGTFVITLFVFTVFFATLLLLILFFSQVSGKKNSRQNCIILTIIFVSTSKGGC